MNDLNEVKAMLNTSMDDKLNFKVDGSSGNTTATYTGGWDTSTNGNTLSAWGYWQDYYYPTVIKQAYPVYIQESAKDKGKQAFEIIKVLKDKKLIDMKKVGDFIDLMDELIKIL